MKARYRMLAGALGFIWLAATSAAGATESPLWLRRAGTEEEDAAWRVATDAAGSAVVAGWTTGALFGAHHGSDDVWVAKYGVGGRRIWARQFGSVDTDQVTGVAINAVGDLYLAGQTSGDLFAPNRSDDLTDAWVAKYRSDGVRRWGRQFGTEGADTVAGIAVDLKGRIFLAGATGGSLAGASRGEADAWLARLDSEGHFVWRRQIGTDAEDGIGALATTQQGGIVVAGTTWGSLAGPNRGLSDAWIGKYDLDGRLLWKRQIGISSWDFADCIATDHAGNILVAGYADRPWLAKYDGGGRLRWRRELGSTSADAARTIATDRTGAVYLATFVGREPGVVKYDRSGQLVASRRIQAADDDIAFAVALDRWRNVFLVGGLALSPDGYRDAWVAKFAPM